MPNDKLPEIPIDETPAVMQRVVALSAFDNSAAAVLAWCREPLFPECALHTDEFQVGVTVEDEQEGQFNEYTVEVAFITENREPDWFNAVSAFATALARNMGGDHLRKTSMAINYTDNGYAVLVRCVVPKFKPALRA